MAKLKLTKSSLKQERDSLKRFQRFLPTLQLKKQQLQMETMRSLERVEKNKAREEKFKQNISSWVSLFGFEPEYEKINSWIDVESVDTEQHNIAGVDIPIYVTTRFKLKSYDLFNESPWIDDAIKAVCDLIEIRKERDVLLEQYRRINRELRVTTQRVNLFEKIKIPESKENIRVIQIYLGDQQTSAVGKSKIAKKKLAEVAND